MRHASRRLSVLFAACLCLRAGAPDVDAALAKFWNARNPAEAAKAANDIAKTGASFDDVYARLRQGRPYSARVATGVVRSKRSGAMYEFPYTLDVPATYDPARAYQVRVQLHGGVMRPLADRRPGGVGRLAGAEQIYVMPVGWDEAPWWSDAQIDNLRAILDSVKRTYNVDENRVVLSGVSDGATGAFYVAMRDVTPYAAFLPLNGSMLVLSHEAFGVGGTLFPHNLRNTVFFIVNGGRDPLYPAASVEPILAHLANGGVSITYRPQPAAGHDTTWWPEVKDGFETFVREHPRVPLPDRLTWETSDARARGRAHWLVIDALGGPGERQPLPDVNRYTPPPQYDPGMRLKGTTVERVVSGSNVDRIGLRERDVIVAVGEVAVASAADVGKALQPFGFGCADSADGAPRRPRRAALRHVRAGRDSPSRRAAVQAHHEIGPGGSGSCRQHGRGHDPRRVGAHAAGVARSVRFRAAGESHDQRSGRVRRPARQERGDAPEMVGSRQRPHDAVRRGADGQGEVAMTTRDLLVCAAIALDAFGSGAGGQRRPDPKTFETHAVFSIDKDAVVLKNVVATIEPRLGAAGYSWLRLRFYPFRLSAAQIDAAMKGHFESIESKWGAVFQLGVDKNFTVWQIDMAVPGNTCTVAPDEPQVKSALQEYRLDGKRLRLKSKGSFVCEMNSRGIPNRRYGWELDLDVPVFQKAS